MFIRVVMLVALSLFFTIAHAAERTRRRPTTRAKPAKPSCANAVVAKQFRGPETAYIDFRRPSNEWYSNGSVATTLGQAQSSKEPEARLAELPQLEYAAIMLAQRLHLTPRSSELRAALAETLTHLRERIQGPNKSSIAKALTASWRTLSNLDRVYTFDLPAILNRIQTTAFFLRRLKDLPLPLEQVSLNALDNATYVRELARDLAVINFNPDATAPLPPPGEDEDTSFLWWAGESPARWGFSGLRDTRSFITDVNARLLLLQRLALVREERTWSGETFSRLRDLPALLILDELARLDFSPLEALPGGLRARRESILDTSSPEVRTRIVGLGRAQRYEQRDAAIEAALETDDIYLRGRVLPREFSSVESVRRFGFFDRYNDKAFVETLRRFSLSNVHHVVFDRQGLDVVLLVLVEARVNDEDVLIADEIEMSPQARWFARFLGTFQVRFREQLVRLAQRLHRPILLGATPFSGTFSRTFKNFVSELPAFSSTEASRPVSLPLSAEDHAIVQGWRPNLFRISDLERTSAQLQFTSPIKILAPPGS